MKLIGFTIPNIKDYDQNVIATFIQKYCLFKTAAFAREVLDRYDNLHFYGLRLTTDILDAQPFPYTPIYTTVDITCISTTLYTLKMTIPNQNRVSVKHFELPQTAYMNITYHEMLELQYFIQRGYIRTIPAYDFNGNVGDYTDFDYLPGDYFTPIS